MRSRFAWHRATASSEPAPLTAPIRTFNRHALACDPVADIDAIRIPSLWFYGDADTIIPVQDSIAAIRIFTVSETAIPQLARGYPEVVIHWIRDLRRSESDSR